MNRLDGASAARSVLSFLDREGDSAERGERLSGRQKGREGSRRGGDRGRQGLGMTLRRASSKARMVLLGRASPLPTMLKAVP